MIENSDPEVVIRVMSTDATMCSHKKSVDQALTTVYQPQDHQLQPTWTWLSLKGQALTYYEK